MQTTANGAVRWRIYSWWAAWVGVAFFAVYPTLNWLSDRRADRWHLYFDAELGLPFVPAFIWVYLSMYALFVAPVFLVPVDAAGLVARAYAWGGRNVEMHVHQVRGACPPMHGVTLPTFMPETG